MSDHEARADHTTAAVALARQRYLDEAHVFGCAETVFTVLKWAYGLPQPDDSSSASALNGGIAYSGGMCGALSGAALAIGQLAERRLGDHAAAKRAAREIIAGTIDEFRAEHGASDCRELIGYDLRAPGGHEAFLASGDWREGCMGRIEWVVTRLATLADEESWERALEELGNSARG